jgi:hypothetical protein
MRTVLRAISQYVVLIALLAAAPQALYVSSVAYAVSSDTAPNAQDVKNPTFQELEHGIADRLKRVDEFRFIEQEAAKLGVRAWLFGGTAAGYAHYVKWDMQREKGDPRFQKDRFDYDYTNIYRSTQDLDIVIDGNAEQAQKLQSALQEKYPHLQGSKTAWEVRLLKQDMGDKLAILNNPDFLNQHTDSNSTGLIEITKPKVGESVVRDVRDWNAKAPFFLKDVQEGKLHYYFSEKHSSTKFAKEGRNPPILSVIRYLTKAFQYELEIRPEDLESIKKVIREFNPKKDTQNKYVANWIEKNSKKLIQNAVNIEYAWDTLEKLGLRKKLIDVRMNWKDVDSLAWWMSKEPLRTQPLGKGRGKTAKELGLDVVAHETNNFLAYESITRAHTGDSNVLISRAGIYGEAAAFGDGFYTAIGREGARGTGLTIRFHLDPNAREGSDFIVEKERGYVIVKNKTALKVIPESLNIGPVEYFKMLTQDNIHLGHSDLGILQKFERRIGHKLSNVDDSQIPEIQNIVKNHILKSKNIEHSPVIKAWFKLNQASQWSEIVNLLLMEGRADQFLLKSVLNEPQWKAHPDWPRWISGFLKRNDPKLDEYIMFSILSEPDSKAHPEWMESLLRYGQHDRDLAQFVLSKPHWRNYRGHDAWIEKILKRGRADAQIATSVLSKPDMIKAHPEWVVRLLARGNADREVARYVLTQSESGSHPDWFAALLKKGTADQELVRHALTYPHWKDHPEFVSQLIESRKAWDFRDSLTPQIATSVLSQPHWKDHPELVESLMKKGTADIEIVQHVLTQPHWNYRQDWAFEILENAEVNRVTQSLRLDQKSFSEVFGNCILSDPQWMKQPRFIEKVLNKPGLWSWVGKYTLAQPQSKSHPEFIPLFIKALEKEDRSTVSNHEKWIDETVFGQPHWKEHPELRRLTGGLPPTYERLKKGMERAEQGRGPAFSIRGCVYNMLNKGLQKD